MVPTNHKHSPRTACRDCGRTVVRGLYGGNYGDKTGSVLPPSSRPTLNFPRRHLVEQSEWLSTLRTVLSVALCFYSTSVKCSFEINRHFYFILLFQKVFVSYLLVTSTSGTKKKNSNTSITQKTLNPLLFLSVRFKVRRLFNENPFFFWEKVRLVDERRTNDGSHGQTRIISTNVFIELMRDTSTRQNLSLQLEREK